MAAFTAAYSAFDISIALLGAGLFGCGTLAVLVVLPVSVPVGVALLIVLLLGIYVIIFGGKIWD